MTTWPCDRVHGANAANYQTAWSMEIMPAAITVNPRVAIYAREAELVEIFDDKIIVAISDAGQVVMLDSAESIAELATALSTAFDRPITVEVVNARPTRAELECDYLRGRAASMLDHALDWFVHAYDCTEEQAIAAVQHALGRRRRELVGGAFDE